MNEIKIYSIDDNEYYDGTISRELTLSVDASLLTIDLSGDLSIAAISYSDGSIFTTDDWQSHQPETREDVKDYRWLDSNGNLAVMSKALIFQA